MPSRIRRKRPTPKRYNIDPNAVSEKPRGDGDASGGAEKDGAAAAAAGAGDAGDAKMAAAMADFVCSPAVATATCYSGGGGG